MAILKLSKEELEIIRQDEADFITDTYAKDRTVQRLRPTASQAAILHDQDTYNYIKDTLDVIIPLANKNGTPITINLLCAALGYGRNAIKRHINEEHTQSLNAGERFWFDKINALLVDTLSVARADVESLQLNRAIDPNSAAKAIKDIDLILEGQQEAGQQTIAVKLVDDM